MAATGASLLLVASIIVVAGNWESIDPVVRFSGLVAALFGVYFAAEAGRRRFPTTSTALATLAACLTAPVGVAAAATLGEPWSVCTLVGGVAALAATEVQSRRWNVAPLKAATVVAFGLAAVGLSALTAIPVSIIGAVGAVAGLLLGSTRRTLTLAVAVGAMPLLVALADAGIGAGTLARMGATGDVLVWSAPLSCAIAAAVIAVLAQRARNAPLAVVSMAVLGSGVLTSLISGDVDGVVWFCVPAIVLLATEAVAATRVDSIWRQLARTATRADRRGTGDRCAGLAIGDAGRSLGCSGRRGRGRSLVRPARAVERSADRVAPSAALGARVAAGCRPRHSPQPWRRCRHWRWRARRCGVSLSPPLFGWIVISVVTPWSTWDITTSTLAVWVLLASFVDEGQPVFWSIALAITGAITVVSCSVVSRRDAGFRTIAAAALAALGTGLVVDEITAVAEAAPFQVGVLVFVGLIGLGAAIRPERSTWPLAIAGYFTLTVITDDPDGSISWFAVATTAAYAAAVAGSSRSLTGVRAHIAASITTAAGGLALTAASVDAGTSVVAASLIGIGLSGLATLDRRLVVGQTAGVTASTIAVVASVAASPVFTSIALIVLGAQLIAVGITTSQWWLRPAGAALTVGATVSLWWTTGTNQWVIDAIAPYGADGSDVAIAAVSRGVARRWLAAASHVRGLDVARLLPWARYGRHVVDRHAARNGDRLGDVRCAGRRHDRPRRRRSPSPRRTARARHSDGGGHDRGVGRVSPRSDTDVGVDRCGRRIAPRDRSAHRTIRTSAAPSRSTWQRATVVARTVLRGVRVSGWSPRRLRA